MPQNEESFDLEAVYDEQIAPLMTKIIDICKLHKMPMFASFLYANDLESGDDGCCTTNLMFTKDRPIPQNLLNLYPTLVPARVPPLRMRVTKGDGSVEETVILG